MSSWHLLNYEYYRVHSRARKKVLPKHVTLLKPGSAADPEEREREEHTGRSTATVCKKKKERERESLHFCIFENLSRLLPKWLRSLNSSLKNKKKINQWIFFNTMCISFTEVEQVGKDCPKKHTGEFWILATYFWNPFYFKKKAIGLWKILPFFFFFFGQPIKNPWTFYGHFQLEAATMHPIPGTKGAAEWTQ